MFREMRRKDKQLGNTENQDLLKRAQTGYLSTICENGYPCSVPLNFVYYNNSIYFHSANEGQKIDNINNCDKVSFSTVCDIENLPDKFDTNYKSVIIFGRAVEVFEKEKEEALLEIIKKHSSDFVEKGKIYIEKSKGSTRVFKINIEYMTGKAQV